MEKIGICSGCKDEIYKELSKKIRQCIIDSKATWEVAIDCVGDLFIQEYNFADDEVTKHYANEVFKCVFENTIKKSRDL